MWLVKNDVALNTKAVIMYSLSTVNDKHFLAMSFGALDELDCKIELFDIEKPKMIDIMKRINFLQSEHDYLDVDDFKREMVINDGR